MPAEGAKCHNPEAFPFAGFLLALGFGAGTAGPCPVARAVSTNRRTNSLRDGISRCCRRQSSSLRKSAFVMRISIRWDGLSGSSCNVCFNVSSKVWACTDACAGNGRATDQPT